MPKKLEEKFSSYCKKQDLEINSSQIKVIKKLEKYYEDNFKPTFMKLFSRNKNKKCFYLYGDVGVGKTMILNFFFELLTEKKIKLHFNEFMINFHDFTNKIKKKKEHDIVHKFVKDLKSKISVIYLDEFQVTNIVDAMILGKLFEQIFKENIKIIVTSNTKIIELYKDGLQRDQFKPFINIMRNESLEHELQIQEDYRKSIQNQKERYFYPLNQETNFKINKFFRTITRNKKLSIKIVNIKGREFKVENFYEGVIRLHFDQLCNQNLGAEDYLQIFKKCSFIIIEKIPQFNDHNSNQQQRFITLLDIIYDKNIPMAVTANQNLDKLTSSRLLKEPFKRTVSRLHELTSKDKN